MISPPDQTTTRPDDGLDPEAVHGWFGLSYSNYQVLPRTLMQSMPALWQNRMVALLEELRAAFSHIEQPDSYRVEAGKWCYIDDLSADELTALGFTRPDAPDGTDEDGELPDIWYGPDGEEHDGHTASVFVTGRDPIPHYNRGRTRIEPDLAAIEEVRRARRDV